MSLSAHQPKEPGQPANQLKEPSQESQILCPDPDVGVLSCLLKKGLHAFQDKVHAWSQH
uniref:Uncharacterized protein n=1 Tax=Cricetulus griseus TaxID=10029 RepID=A0A8C2MIU9_CRIGR